MNDNNTSWFRRAWCMGRSSSGGKQAHLLARDDHEECFFCCVGVKNRSGPRLVPSGIRTGPTERGRLPWPLANYPKRDKLLLHNSDPERNMVNGLLNEKLLLSRVAAFSRRSVQKKRALAHSQIFSFSSMKRACDVIRIALCPRSNAAGLHRQPERLRSRPPITIRQRRRQLAAKPKQ